MNIQPINSAAAPPGIYSSWLGANAGKARGNPNEPDSIIQQLQALSPEEQNNYAMAHAQGDGGFAQNAMDAFGTAAKFAAPFALASGAGALADAAGFGGIEAGAGSFEAPTAVAGTTQWAPGEQLASNAGFSADGAFSDIANGGAFTSGAPATGGLDTIGNMVQNVPPGMTATSYAQSLGYPSADAWLASGAGTGAAVGAAGASSSGGNAITDSGTNAGDSTFAQEQAGQLTKTASPSILDVVGNFLNGGGLVGKIATSLGLPSGVASGIGSAWNIGSGLYGMYQSDQIKKQAQKAAALADPFAAQRAQYQAKLSALMNDPSSITSTPGYEAGLQAVQRSMAAQGYNGSGNMMTALSKYGGDFYNNAVSQLSGLSGAQFNPGNAGNLTLSGDIAASGVLGNSINRIGQGLTQKGSLFNPSLAP